MHNCVAIKGDVSKYNEANLVIKFNKYFEKLDILVCNVGSGKAKKKIPDIKEWHQSFDINFWSTVNIINSSKKILIKSNSSIICISSICGLENIKGAPIPYSVAKSALNSFVVNQSKFLGNFKVRINAIAPGNIMFNGSTWSKKMKKSPSNTKKYINKNVALKILGKTSDISNMTLI